MSHDLAQSHPAAGHARWFDESRRHSHTPRMELVLSLFPGADMLGRGFKSRGFSVVRGADLILDERIEDDHYPAGKFDGVIGGPPCQNYSDANRTRNPTEGDRLVREFLRAIAESQPRWFLMENVRNVPDVAIEGYTVQRLHLTDAECGGRQRRLRAIQFGSRDGSIIRPLRTTTARPVTPAVLCRPVGKHDRHSRRVARQGSPPLPLKSLTKGARSLVIGNAVSWPMALVLAEAVRSRSPAIHNDCPCGCGRVTQNGTQATAACRKRQQRRRDGLTRLVRLVDHAADA